MRYIFVLLLVFIFVEPTLAQNGFKLHVFVNDSLTNLPLEAASVSVNKHKHLHITNQNGQTTIDSLTEGNYLLHVFYVGYHHADVVVKIPHQKSVVIDLCPENFHLHESLITDENNLNSVLNKSILSSENVTKAGAQNLAELTGKISGVTSLSSSGAIAKPVIRGLHGQRLVIITGNSKLEGQQWGEDHAPEVDINNIYEVEIIKGAAGVEFGSDAIGGVIKLKPKSFLNANGFAGAINLSAYSNNKQGASNVLVQGKKNNFAWNLGGTLRKAGDSKTPEYILSNTAFNEQNFNAATELSLKKLTLNFSFSSYNSNQAILAAAHLGNIDDLKRALTSNKPLIILPFSYAVNRPFMQVNHNMFNATLHYIFNKNTQLNYSYNQQVNRRQEFDTDRPYNQALRNLPAVDFEILSVDNALTLNKKLSYHVNLKTGVNYQFQNNTVLGTQYVIPPFFANTFGGFLLVEKERLNAKFGAGMRYDFRLLDVPTFSRYGKTYSYSRSFNSPTFVLSYLQKFKQDFLLNTTVSSAWRAPTVNELYSNGLHYGIANYEIGDSNLTPEHAINLDITLKKNYKNWFFSLSVFNQYFTNFIYKLPLPEPTLTIRGAFPTFKFNQSKANLAGAEFDANYKPELGVYFGSNISFLYATDIGLNQPLIFMPANRVNNKIGYSFKNYGKFLNAFTELNVLYVAMQKRVPVNIDYTNPPADYFLLGVNLGSEINYYKNLKPAFFSINFNNLLNTNYRDYMSRFRYFANETGLNIIIKLQLPF